LGLFDGQLGVVGLNRGLYQSHVGVAPGDVVSGRRQLVQPPDMDFSTLHIAVIQQFQQERLVTGTALDDNNAAAQCSL
jgi:hypothetical protein